MTDTAVATAGETSADAYVFNTRIEDAGVGTKRIVVDIPAEKVRAEIDSQMKELRMTAVLPGFRPGKAPAKLLEKKFGEELKNQVRQSLVSQSLQQAVEKADLKVLGEPEFENPAAVKIEDGAGLNFSVTLEVTPEITLPDLSGFVVKKPKIGVTEANVDQAMKNLKQQQGMLVPVEDRGVETGDTVLCDIHLKESGNVIAHQHDAQVIARPGRISGIQIDDFDKQLAGAKPGEKKVIAITVPSDYPQEAIRGKSLEMEVAVKELKRLEEREIDDIFLEELGFTSVDDVRAALREQLEERVSSDIAQTMRDQLAKHLIEAVQLDVPAKSSARQTDRVVQRRAMDLLYRGVPREQIQANVDAIRNGADEQARRELKLFFVLNKVANDHELEVDEDKLNSRIALMAAFRGLRPDKLRQDMAKDGSLQNLYLQMREQTALDKLIEGCKVEEVEVATNPDGTMIKPEEGSEEAKV